MKLSIIGSNGFLSSTIGEYCNSIGVNVTSYGLGRPLTYNVNEHIEIDLINEELDMGGGIAENDIIIYAAGAGIQSNLTESADTIYKLNAFCPVKINYELSKLGYKGTFITFGSYFEIGNNEAERLFDEVQVCNSMLKVPNHYCLSKRLLTRYIASLMENTNHLHVILPTIYGKGEAQHRIIPYTVRAIRQNEPMQFTAGHQIRQYLYVRDIPFILIELCRLKKTGIYNLPGIETYSIRQLVKIIHDYFNLKMSENIFGKALRADVGMQNLQMDGSQINKTLPSINYTLFRDAVKLYDE